jgi:hypothetical protein
MFVLVVSCVVKQALGATEEYAYPVTVQSLPRNIIAVAKIYAFENMEVRVEPQQCTEY